MNNEVDENNDEERINRMQSDVDFLRLYLKVLSIQFERMNSTISSYADDIEILQNQLLEEKRYSKRLRLTCIALCLCLLFVYFCLLCK